MFFYLEVPYYCDLQVHKHVQVNERVPRLEALFERHRNQIPLSVECYDDGSNSVSKNISIIIFIERV